MIVCTMIFSACEHDELITGGQLNGAYTGTFYRMGPNTDYEVANVTLFFCADGFKGGSSIAKYPAICQGNYKLLGHSIEFNNTCFWTADFDWSYILSGTFNISIKGDEILLKRYYSDNVFDAYVLTKSSELKCD